MGSVLQGLELRVQVAGDSGDVASLMQPIPSHKRIHVEMMHVSAWVPNFFSRPSRLSKLASLLRRGKEVADAGKYRQASG